MAEASLSETDRLVAAYLSKRGYRDAEAALRQDAVKQVHSNDLASDAQRLLQSFLNANIDDHSSSAPLLKWNMDVQSSHADTNNNNNSTTPTGTRAGSSSLAATSSAYEQGYMKLKRWIDESLDLYKGELHSVLYPLFVHCFLDLTMKGLSVEARRFFDAHRAEHASTVAHATELTRLSSVTDPAHVREHATAQLFRTHKYTTRMSRYAFDLLIGFMQDHRLMALLRIVNQHLHIRVHQGLQRGDEPTQTMIGLLGLDTLMTPNGPMMTGNVNNSNNNNNNNNNTSSQVVSVEEAQQVPVLWGTLPWAEKRASATSMGLVEESEESVSADLPAYAEELEQTFKETLRRTGITDMAVMEAAWQKAKKLRGGAGSSLSPARDRIPLPNPTKQDLLLETKLLTELSKSTSLERRTLPSICCYTMANTFDGMNHMQFSADASLLSCSFADSFIEICSLTQRPLRAVKSSLDFGPIDLHDVLDVEALRESSAHSVKKLIGHSGPVYATRFSYDTRHLVSASQDGTARLWSLDSFRSLVVYRGHQRPIWDVDYGPFGVYFATASADRTARLWSSEHLQPLRIFAGHLSDVETIRFHPNSNYVATGSSDRTARLWDIQKGSCVRVFAGHQGAVSALAISPDGRTLATADDAKSVMIWDLASGRSLQNWRIPDMNNNSNNSSHPSISRTWSLSFSRDGTLLASGGADGVVRLWDVNETSSQTALVGSFATKQTPIYTAQFNYRNILLVGGALTPLELGTNVFG